MAYDYDVLVIGLGPAGMAVSIMASEMDLRVCAIEANKVGGECMNVGCIPSKSLLQTAKVRALMNRLDAFGLAGVGEPKVVNAFRRIHDHLGYINETKTMSMFDKVDVVLKEGKAGFVNDHTVEVGGRKISSKRIFICAGTRPALPKLEGLWEADPLTNETMFDLEEVPSSLIVLGGGAIACEMAQAFARLGTRVTMVMRGASILWRDDADAAELVQKALAFDGIELRTKRTMQRVEKTSAGVVLHTEEDAPLAAERILSATGRRMAFDALKLENAGVKHTDRGIVVNRRLQTSRKNIYACGDCNGHHQLSHSAMHQGMVGLMNAILPWPMKLDFRKFVVPWTVFTEPAYSYVGRRQTDLETNGVTFETIRVNYEDYGAAIAEELGEGFVKVHVSPMGRIHGVCVVGEGSGDMINEWGLAIQKKLGMKDIMFLQHSFPSMAFLNKRAAETWMMNRMKSGFVRGMMRFLYRF